MAFHDDETEKFPKSICIKVPIIHDNRVPLEFIEWMLKHTKEADFNFTPDDHVLVECITDGTVPPDFFQYSSVAEDGIEELLQKLKKRKVFRMPEKNKGEWE